MCVCVCVCVSVYACASVTFKDGHVDDGVDLSGGLVAGGTIWGGLGVGRAGSWGLQVVTAASAWAGQGPRGGGHARHGDQQQKKQPHCAGILEDRGSKGLWERYK